jgi:hypothetical protein
MQTDPPKRKRRWFQFSLRTLLILSMICIWPGVTAIRASRQRRAVETIIHARGHVFYNYEGAESNPASGTSSRISSGLTKFAASRFS